eukprot:UN06640
MFDIPPQYHSPSEYCSLLKKVLDNICEHTYFDSTISIQTIEKLLLHFSAYRYRHEKILSRISFRVQCEMLKGTNINKKAHEHGINVYNNSIFIKILKCLTVLNFNDPDYIDSCILYFATNYNYISVHDMPDLLWCMTNFEVHTSENDNEITFLEYVFNTVTKNLKDLGISNRTTLYECNRVIRHYSKLQSQLDIESRKICREAYRTSYSNHIKNRALYCRD